MDTLDPLTGMPITPADRVYDLRQLRLLEALLAKHALFDDILFLVRQRIAERERELASANDCRLEVNG